MRKLATISAVLLLVGLGFAQKTSGQSGVTAAIEKADKERTQAVVKADLATLEKTTGDTYTFTDANGRVSTKKEVIDGVRTGSIKIQSQDISDVKVHVYGNTAVETGKLTGKGTRDGQDISGTFRFTRVWVNHNGTWETVAFQETKVP